MLAPRAANGAPLTLNIMFKSPFPSLFSFSATHVAFVSLPVTSAICLNPKRREVSIVAVPAPSGTNRTVTLYLQTVPPSVRI
jgi:hypothetical protein